MLLFPALLLANFVLIQLVTPGQPQRVEVSYTFFKQQVEADNVAQISTRADTIQGTFRQPVAYQPDLAVAAKTVGRLLHGDPGVCRSRPRDVARARTAGSINARPLDQPSQPAR